MHKHAFIYNSSMWFATRLRKLMPAKIGVWTSVRSAPKLAPKTLHERVKAHQAQTKKAKRKLTCLPKIKHQARQVEIIF